MGDAPVDALLVRTEDLAKGWLLALLEQAPLDDAPAIVGADLTRDGPRVCDAVVRALADEDDLRRLEPGGALEPLVARIGELVGVGSDAAAISGAVDALEGVIWSALRAELGGAEAELISELAERLALVAGLVRGAALRSAVATPLGSAAPSPGPAYTPATPPAAHTPPAPTDVSVERPVPRPVPVPPPEVEEDPSSTSDAEAVSGARSNGDHAPAPDVVESAPPPPPTAPPQPPASPPPPAAAPPAPAAAPAPEALWIGAVEDEIARAEKADSLLSLLLVELEDADRVLAAEDARDASATFGRFAQALRSVVRRQDILACETESRAWIIARDTGRAGAQALASRTARAVREARPWHGAPMTVNAGVAVFREDGHDPASLMDAAEQAKYAAAAAGLAVIHEMPPEGNGPRLVS